MSVLTEVKDYVVEEPKRVGEHLSTTLPVKAKQYIGDEDLDFDEDILDRIIEESESVFGLAGMSNQQLETYENQLRIALRKYDSIISGIEHSLLKYKEDKNGKKPQLQPPKMSKVGYLLDEIRDKYKKIKQCQNYIQAYKIYDYYCKYEMHELKKICNPIIKRKGVPSMYHDDLYSLAIDTLIDSVKRYDGSKDCKFKTFLTGNIKRTFYDWTRDSRRIKRCNVERDWNGKVKRDEEENVMVIPDVSIDTPIVWKDDSSSTIIDTLASNFNLENEISEEIGLLFDDRVEKYLNSLPRKAREIVNMKMNDIPVEEIKAKLELTNGEYNNYMNAARTNEHLELFTKSFKKQGDDKMCEIMPIDTTDNYRMDKNPLGGLLDEKRDGDINCKYILQRKAFQWTKKQKNKFLTRILNNQPIPEIVICEQYVNNKKKRHLIDGLQRLSYAGLYRAKGTVVELDGAEFYEIQYEEKVFDENGTPVLDEDGDIKKVQKTFNVIGKKFDELPKFLQDRFNKFNINITTYFDCTDEQIAYHIRNYNNHEGMTGNQYEVTNIDVGMAGMIKDISCEHSFFKDRCGNYTEKNEAKGVLERVVVESIIAMNFLSNWKKKPEDAYEFVNQNATKDLFVDFKESLDRLCGIVDKSNRKLFNTTNSPVWFSVFSRFKRLGLSDNNFADFLNYFIISFESLEVDGINFMTTYKNSNTKDKSVITSKIDGIEKLMNDFLHIKKNEPASVENKDISSVVVDEEIQAIDFVKEYVKSNVTEDDIDDYYDMLDEYKVDKSSPLLDWKNEPSLIALIAYSFENDIDLDDWIIEYFKKKNTYLVDQKENYLHMLDDLEKFKSGQAA